MTQRLMTPPLRRTCCVQNSETYLFRDCHIPVRMPMFLNSISTAPPPLLQENISSLSKAARAYQQSEFCCMRSSLNSCVLDLFFPPQVDDAPNGAASLLKINTMDRPGMCLTAQESLHLLLFEGWMRSGRLSGRLHFKA